MQAQPAFQPFLDCLLNMESKNFQRKSMFFEHMGEGLGVSTCCGEIAASPSLVLQLSPVSPSSLLNVVSCVLAIT